MPQPTEPVLTVSQMQAAEERAIQAGTSEWALMQKAGEGAAEWVWRLAAGRAVTVLCGPGNNGGDGYVIAEVLRQRGLDVTLVAPLEPTTESARHARNCYEGDVQSGLAGKGGILVDCLFGTGQDRPVAGDLEDMLACLRRSHAQLVAVDLPTNVAADTAERLGPVPQHCLTISLGAWKQAHWTMPAAQLMGERRLVDIGIRPPPDAAELVRFPDLAEPAPDSHKYSRGMCVIMGGDMAGAGVLAACAAHHGGAGYVKMLRSECPDDLPSDIVFQPAAEAETALTERRVGAVLIGPGLGRSDEARRLLRLALSSHAPRVLDADALSLVKPGDDLDGVLATPHEGELAILCETFGIDATGKLARAKALQAATGMTVLAKGPDTMLVGDGGQTAFFPSATPWLSTAGTGDALAGLAASRMATGRDPFLAACDAVLLHAQAARLAGPAFSAKGLIAALPRAYGALL